MKVNCIHGYFIFEETSPGQVSDFMSLTGLSLSRRDKYYTFTSLLNVLNYSLKKKPIMGVEAKKTFAGMPWDVMRANGLVYDFNTDKIVEIASVNQRSIVKLNGNIYKSSGLILPGTLMDQGQKILSYSGFYSRQKALWTYSEVLSV